MKVFLKTSEAVANSEAMETGNHSKNETYPISQMRMINWMFAFIVLLASTFTLNSCKTGGTVDYSLIPVSNDGERWGYINRKGEYVITPQFEDADFFSDGLARIKSGDGKTGYINKKGEYAIPATYKSGTAFSGGLAFVAAEGGLPTCIDKTGNIKFSLNAVQYVSAFSEGLAIFITEKGEYGFVDKSGNMVINAQFEGAMPFSGGFARISQKGDNGFIDKTGKIAITPQFKAVGNFSEEKAAFFDGKQWGYVSTKGVYTINPQFDDAGIFSNGMAAIRQGRSYGYINKEGKLLINPQFDHASSFSERLAAVQSGGKFGYIDKAGKYEINTQFEYAGNFYEGIALVRNADKWGFINKKGKYLVNPQFNRVKHEAAIDSRPDFVENDYYDTSEFIKKFFEREAGNTFDGINASTTLEALSEHPVYGEGLNARDRSYAEYRQTIKLTNEVYIGHVVFQFMKTPIYEMGRSREFNFSATPDAIEYRIGLNGKAYEKRSVVMSALRNEIERSQGQSGYEVGSFYFLTQDNGKLNFAMYFEGSSIVLFVAFNEEYLSDRFGGI